MDGCNRDRVGVVAAERGERDMSTLARIIWETSRADEGTISATGANIVARAILRSDWLVALADDNELMNTVAQGMTPEAFEDMPLADVLALRGCARAALWTLAAALAERQS